MHAHTHTHTHTHTHAHTHTHTHTHTTFHHFTKWTQCESASMTLCTVYQPVCVLVWEICLPSLHLQYVVTTRENRTRGQSGWNVKFHIAGPCLMRAVAAAAVVVVVVVVVMLLCYCLLPQVVSGHSFVRWLLLVCVTLSICLFVCFSIFSVCFCPYVCPFLCVCLYLCV